MTTRHAARILDIDFTIGTTNDDIFEVDGLTFYRDAQSRTAGNGFSLTAQQSATEGGTRTALDAGADLATVEAWIWLGEQQVSPSVIVLDMATTAS